MNPFVIALLVGVALGTAAVTVLILLSVLFTYTRLGWKKPEPELMHEYYQAAFRLAMTRFSLTGESTEPKDYDNIVRYMRTYFNTYQIRLNVDHDTVDLLAMEEKQPKMTSSQILDLGRMLRGTYGEGKWI
jgi:hypothetical protein